MTFCVIPIVLQLVVVRRTSLSAVLANVSLGTGGATATRTVGITATRTTVLQVGAWRESLVNKAGGEE